MTKQEIIQNLTEYVKYSNICSKWIDAEKEALDEIARLKNEKAPLKSPTFKDLLIIVIISGIIGYVVAYIINVIFHNNIDNTGIMSLRVAIAVIPFVILLIKKQAKYDKEENVKIKEEHFAGITGLIVVAEMDLEKARKNKTICVQQMKKCIGVMPEDYRRDYIARKFLSYFKNGRADTMKEAINLYEMEERQEEAYRETARHNRVMEEEAARQSANLAAARNEASRAADASEQAVKDMNFWNFIDSLDKK